MQKKLEDSEKQFNEKHQEMLKTQLQQLNEI